MPEERIRDYIIEGLLGRGGMGSVYLARHVHMGTKAALKVLHEQYSDDPSIKSRFVNEARLLHELSHPNIVEQKEFFEENGRLVLVMEYVEGRGLDEMIGQEVGPIPWEKALPLFSQVVEGISYAHSKGIIHRDIKPSNILVTKDEKVKITDLGIAKLAGQQGMTRAGTQLGTLYYMSPEQIRGSSDIDNRSDIYSLGMTLYEMLAGRLPFDTGDNATDFAVSSRIVEGAILDPREYYPHIPEWLVDVVSRAISKDRQDRFQSCEELLHALSGNEVFATNNLSNSIEQDRVDRTIISGNESPSTPLAEKTKSRLHPAIIIMSALVGLVLVIILISKIGKPSLPTEHEEPQPQPAVAEEAPVVYPDPSVNYVTSYDHCESIRRDGNCWTYVADNMVDGDWSTAWSANYDQSNAWFTVFLNDHSTIGRISIVPGFVKHNAVVDDLFEKNHRLRSVRISFPSGRNIYHTFEDSPTMQDIQVTPPEIADKFTVHIESIYPSNRYDDLAISELRVTAE